MATEADTCRKFVVPKLQAAGWDSDPHSIAGHRIDFPSVAAQAGKPEADPFNLLLKYPSDGELQLVAVRKHLPDMLKVRPISDHGNVAELAQRFGGFEKLGEAVNQLQSLFYAN